MARKTIGTLNTAITADAQQYLNEFKRAQRATTQGVTSIVSSLKSVGGALGISLGVGSVLAFSKSVVDLGSQITDLSAVASMGTSQFQAIALTAMDSGLEFEQTAKAAENMRSKIEDASKGNVAATATFKTLGLTAAGLQALAPERQWEVIATAISTAKDKQAAMNAASDIFGAKIAPKLRETIATLASEGFDKLNNSTKGLQFSPEQLKTLDDAGDKMAKIWHYTKLIGATALTAKGVDTTSAGQIAELEKRIAAYEAKGRGMSPNAMDYKRSLAALKERESATRSVQAAAAAAAAEIKLYSDAVNDAAMQNAEQIAAAVRKEEDAIASRKNGLRMSARDSVWLQGAIGATQKATSDLASEQIALGAKMEDAAMTPLQKYMAEIERLNGLEAAGVISTEAAAAAMGVAGSAYTEAAGSAEDYQTRVEAAAEAQDKLPKVGDEFALAMEQMWGRVADNASESMAEILLNGTNTFEELGRVIVKTMLTAAIKAQLIMPLMNFIGGANGLAPGLFGNFGGAKADGGPVRGGKSYLVGEEGPEMFSPSASGTITPNRSLAGAGSGGGDNLVFNYSFAAGVTKAELMPLLALTQQTTLAKIADARRRGGSRANAFA